jgi:beta-N-acetylhexosaminidase
VAPSLKHWPGHGDTHVDSHLALPVITKDLDALRRTELVPFAASSDAASIMTGHIALPALTGTDAPASLSRLATHGLARDQLGYDGLIVTDCLEMAAVAAREGGVSRGAVDALKAGADVVMICHTYVYHVGAIEAACNAVASGEVLVEEIERSGKRVAVLKDRFAGSWSNVLDRPFQASEWQALKATHMKLSERAYAASTAVIQDPAHQLPLSNPNAVLLVTPVPESINLAVDDADGMLRTNDGKVRNTAGPSFLAFAAAVRARCPNTTHIVCTPDAALEEDAVHVADAVIFVTRNADRAAWQLDHLRNVARLRGGIENGIIVVESCAPYDLVGLKKDDELLATTVLATFEFTAQSLAAAVAVIFGESEAMGKVPVCSGKVIPCKDG